MKFINIRLPLIKITIIVVIFSLASCLNIGSDESLEVVEETYTPLSIKGMKHRVFNSRLSLEKKLLETELEKADLWSYYSDSLKIYSLINTPLGEIPNDGFPVVIFGHGFHPKPENYGVSAVTNKDWRPGDYYRGIPEAFARNGFLTITPDYRGHNKSEGFEYTKMSYLSSSFYAIDVLHLLSAIQQFDNINQDRVYFLGHSMGGDVGLKVLLSSDIIRAASLWAPVTASTFDQALYYGDYYDENSDVITDQKLQNYLSNFDKAVASLPYDFDSYDGDPIFHINTLETPLIIHHGRQEESVPFMWSMHFIAELYKHNKKFEFYPYETDNHLFKDDMLSEAIDRDITFFNKHK